jgi:hypothetical protein
MLWLYVPHSSEALVCWPLLARRNCVTRPWTFFNTKQGFMCETRLKYYFLGLVTKLWSQRMECLVAKDQQYEIQVK